MTLKPFSKSHLQLVALAFSLASLGNIADASTGPAQTSLIAFADNAYTAATNPAGLTRIEQTEWLGQGQFFVSESTFVKQADDISGEQTTDSDGFLIAPFLYYARPLNERWTFGASVTALGFGEDLGEEGPGRYLVEEWTSAIATVAPAIGYRVNDKLSLGGALGINYTYYSFTSAIFNGIGIPDGELEVEASALSVSPRLSMLYEFSPSTRIGFSWAGEDDPSLSDTPTVSDAPGITPEEITISSLTPQAFSAGLWHQFEQGSSISLDLIWAEFSEFGLSEIIIDDGVITPRNQDFNDVWAVTLGYQMPLRDRWIGKVGLLYTSQFIDDVNRTQKLKLDQIWGLGIGGEYEWSKDRIVGINLTYYDLGDGPIQTTIPGLGSFSGSYTTHHSLGLDLTFRWKRGPG